MPRKLLSGRENKYIPWHTWLGLFPGKHFALQTGAADNKQFARLHIALVFRPPIKSKAHDSEATT